MVSEGVAVDAGIRLTPPTSWCSRVPFICAVDVEGDDEDQEEENEGLAPLQEVALLEAEPVCVVTVVTVEEGVGLEVGGGVLMTVVGGVTCVLTFCGCSEVGSWGVSWDWEWTGSKAVL